MKNLKYITTTVSLFCILGTAKPDSLMWTAKAEDSTEIKIDTMIARMGLSSETPGGVVGVIKDGKLIFQKAYGLANFDTKEPNKISTLFNLASVSKQYTAAAILFLANEKKLSLKDDIRKYLPDFPDYGCTITIENLIHHTSGIRSFDVLDLMAGRLNANEDQKEAHSLIIKQKAINFKPGDEFLYSNSGYLLLADIIEKVSGMKFSKFIEENIFRPIGMSQSFIYDNPDRVTINCASGHEWGDEEKFKRSVSLISTVVGESNVYTSVGDFLQWDNNFYKNRLGTWDFSKEMTSQTTLRNGDTCDYAFGLEIGKYKGLYTISHQGGTNDFTAKYLQIPSEKFAVVCLFNIPTDVTGLAKKITDLFVKGIPQPLDSSVNPGKKSVDSTVLKLYAGIYFDENHGFSATVSREGDHLIFDAPYQGKFELFPSSDTTFFVTFADLRFIFSKDAGGTIKKCTIIQGSQIFSLAYFGTKSLAVTGEKLKQYAGEYFSEDINATYPVVIKDNKLYVRFPESTAKFCKIQPETELISDHADFFASPVGGFEFTRDTKNEISGFIIKDLGRVRNLAFSKTN